MQNNLKQLSKLQNIFLVGPMGAGKTSIGKQLANHLDLKFYDSDEVLEQTAGADILWILDVEGEECLQKREAKIIAELTKKRGILLATGGGCVALAENRAALTGNGIVIYLKTSLEGQVKRTGLSKKRPLSKDVTLRREALNSLWLAYEPLYERIADLVFDTGCSSIRFIVDNLVEELRAKGYI